MGKLKYLEKFEPGELLKLQVSKVAKDGIYLVDEIDEEGQSATEIFMHFSQLKTKAEKYDYLYVGVDIDPRGKKGVTTKIVQLMEKYEEKAVGLKRGDSFSGIIYNITDFGAFAISNDKVIGLIHDDEINSPVAVGAKVEARVTFVRDDGRVNLSLRPLKEIGRVSDAERILEFLKKRKGTMPYSDESSPQVIKDKFNISKNAFKRALGKLLKDGLVEQREGWTYLKE